MPTSKRNSSNRKPSARKTAQPVPAPAEAPTAQPGKYEGAWLTGGFGTAEDVLMPSGQLALVRRVGVQGLMAEGVLHDVDALSSLVGKKHLQGPKDRKDKGGGAQVNARSILKDPEALEKIMHTVDRVVSHCVVKPEVLMAPNDVTLRKPGVVYTDMIDLVDKMFIFNYVAGGSRDLERFRRESEGFVGSLEAG